MLKNSVQSQVKPGQTKCNLVKLDQTQYKYYSVKTYPARW